MYYRKENAQGKREEKTMTRQDLIKMTGSKEQAEYALDILLKGIKEPFMRMAIEAELARIEDEMKAYEEQGLIYRLNGTEHVDAAAPERVFGNEPGAYWNSTEEQRQRSEEIREQVNKAEALLYRRNRTVALLAFR